MTPKRIKLLLEVLQDLYDDGHITNYAFEELTNAIKNSGTYVPKEGTK